MKFSFHDIIEQGFTISEHKLDFYSDSKKRKLGYGSYISKLIQPGEFSEKALPFNFHKHDFSGKTEINIFVSSLYVKISPLDLETIARKRILKIFKKTRNKRI
ncbi:hypothetical protein RF11_04701 [Thelohanellus kitauei]|uniref:Uncharacterized protein n=1 Tax=Thelohanellus kitauei TaxID=669202 RepID=A0A0C2J6A3_THEKT|nr:hypothetical protein RF11_04701 [Thelohanellus kitauei]